MGYSSETCKLGSTKCRQKLTRRWNLDHHIILLCTWSKSKPSSSSLAIRIAPPYATAIPLFERRVRRVHRLITILVHGNVVVGSRVGVVRHELRESERLVIDGRSAFDGWSRELKRASASLSKSWTGILTWSRECC